MNLLQIYENFINIKGYKLIKEQAYVMDQLSHYFHHKSLFSKKPAPAFIYLFGPVGTGKSLLMDIIEQSLPTKRKVRYHWHFFIRQLQDELYQHTQDSENPFLSLIQDFKHQYDYLFIDELFINDIADAMLMQRFFLEIAPSLFVFTTSNFSPSKLYPSTFKKDTIQQWITFLNHKATLLNLTGQDLRKNSSYLKENNLSFSLGAQNAQPFIQRIYARYGYNGNPHDVVFNHRKYIDIYADNPLIHFTFKQFQSLLVGPMDIAYIVKHYPHVMITNIENITDNNLNVLRKLITLIDLLYEQPNAKFYLHSVVQTLEQIYTGKQFHTEWARTLSRIRWLLSEHKKTTPT